MGREHAYHAYTWEVGLKSTQAGPRINVVSLVRSYPTASAAQEPLEYQSNMDSVGFLFRRMGYRLIRHKRSAEGGPLLSLSGFILLRFFLARTLQNFFTFL